MYLFFYTLDKKKIKQLEMQAKQMELKQQQFNAIVQLRMQKDTNKDTKILCPIILYYNKSGVGVKQNDMT